jgi:glycosyltransferase involved in cell wall biosynthesis
MISIFTPVHRTSSPFLKETYTSLKEQTFTDWQWVVVLNNGGYVFDGLTEDKRVKIIEVPKEKYDDRNIGWLKNFCVKNCDGEIAVELDADDMLTENALQKIYEAFEDKEIVFAYSNSSEFVDETWEPRTYSTYYGWRHRDFEYKGHKLIETLAWPPSAQMMRRIEWAPNHVRCWRTLEYWKIGGHNVEISSGDDHDLLCRMYLTYGAKRMKLIDECLYLYRVHNNNTCIVENNGVQEQVLKNYLKYSRDLAIKWADENNLLKIDLGGRFNAWYNFTTVDLFDADMNFDLNDTWKLADNSVGVLRASNIFEHLKNPIHAMNEAYRVLAPGGFLFLEVPSTDGRGAYQDPTHISFWNENSIWYYTNENYARFIKPQFKGRFQNARTVTYYPDDFCKQNNISFVQADLIALKGDYAERPAGEILI